MNQQNPITQIFTALGSILPALLFWFMNKNKQKVKSQELEEQKSIIHNKLHQVNLSNLPTLKEEAAEYNQSLYELSQQDKAKIQIDILDGYLRDGSKLITNLDHALEHLLDEDPIERDSIIYDLSLKLKAPESIQKVFNNFPCHLKSQYRIKVAIKHSDEFLSQHKQKFVHSFSREDFYYAKKYLSLDNFDIMTLSKNNHCYLEYRPPEKSITILDFPHQQQWQLYLVVNGKSGVQIKRENQIFHIQMGQDARILQKDEIILLPQLSFLVKNMNQYQII